MEPGYPEINYLFKKLIKYLVFDFMEKLSGKYRKFPSTLDPTTHPDSSGSLPFGRGIGDDQGKLELLDLNLSISLHYFLMKCKHVGKSYDFQNH